MSGDFLFRMVLGHLIGDYLFQNNWMALNKGSKFFNLFVHCILYTGTIVLCICQEFLELEVSKQLLLFFLIFLTHALFDGTTLINRYLHIIGGRSVERTLDFVRTNLDSNINQYYISFSALVYTVADNTVHLALMYIVFRVFL